MSDHYAYRVTWSQADEECVATVAEFPSLSWLAQSRGAALDGLVAAVSDIVADMIARGETPPLAFSDKTYSTR